MLSNKSKTLLKNIIKHTDTHNRIVEESEMWRTYELRKEREHRHKRHGHSGSDSKSVQSSIYKVPRAHMDRNMDSGHDSMHWKRKLQEMEENDPDRWGHTGYKELYPEQFIKDSDQSSSSGDEVKRSKCKRRKVDKHHKTKKKRKHKEKKHRKHKSKERSHQWVVRHVPSAAEQIDTSS